MNASSFHSLLEEAKRTVKKILSTDRSPKDPERVHHKYADKFDLVNTVTNGYLQSLLGALEFSNVRDANLSKMREWVKKGRAVSLRFEESEKCALDRKTSREVVSANKYVKTTTSRFGTSNTTVKRVHTVTEWFWNFEREWTLLAYPGSDPSASDKIVLRARSCKKEIRTNTSTSPRPPATVMTPIEVNVTWIVGQVAPFAIDRSDTEKCRTPRRNGDVEAILRRSSDLGRFCAQVTKALVAPFGALEPESVAVVSRLWQSHGRKLLSVPAALYAFEESAGGGSGVLCFSGKDASAFEAEHVRELDTFVRKSVSQLCVASDAGGGDSRDGGSDMLCGSCNRGMKRDERASHVCDICGAKSTSFRCVSGCDFDVCRKCWNKAPKSKPKAPVWSRTLLSRVEGALYGIIGHVRELTKQYSAGVDAVEEMLRTQIVRAIGKTVTPKDFDEYMNWHYTQIFFESYRPRPFCHSVGGGEDTSPEGAVSIEFRHRDEYVRTSSVSGKGPPLRFALNAASNVTFRGVRHLHTTLFHQFSVGSGPNISLVARAKQFSSFVMLVGTMASKEEFAPVAATVIRNKDDLNIPLFLETIPSPKAFKRAVQSISPEQQAFCKAYRRMQLASSVFCVLIIPVKPQLERVLGLDAGSLSKEIALTEGLVDLFATYQIPTDLLSYDGSHGDKSSEAKLRDVRRNYGRVQSTIAKAKQKELEEARMRALKTLRMSERRDMYEKEKEECAVGALLVRCEDDDVDDEEEEEEEEDCDDFGGSVKSLIREKKDSAGKPTTDTEPSTKKIDEPQKNESTDVSGGDVEPSNPVDVDFTRIPSVLNTKFDELDDDDALCPTKIRLSTEGGWTLKSQDGLLSDPKIKVFGSEDVRNSKNFAFDLLDGLTKSGAVDIADASMHVVLAATHMFDKTLMDSLVQDSINPIEKVEKSQLIMVSTIHARSPRALLVASDVGRVAGLNPKLLSLEEEGV
eukprot:g4703.t1